MASVLNNCGVIAQQKNKSKKKNWTFAVNKFCLISIQTSGLLSTGIYGPMAPYSKEKVGKTIIIYSSMFQNIYCVDCNWVFFQRVTIIVHNLMGKCGVDM